MAKRTFRILRERTQHVESKATTRSKGHTMTKVAAKMGGRKVGGSKKSGQKSGRGR